MRARISLILVLFLSIVASIKCYSQTNTSEVSKITQSEYEELKSEIPFDKTKNALRLKPKKKKKSGEKVKKEKRGISFYDSISFFQIIPYLLIAAIIGFILYYIFSNIEIDKKIEPKLESVFDIEDIEVIDTLDGFQKAIAAGDYRSAIRWRFLNALQILAKKEIIDWQPEKTNRDYNRELRGRPQSKSFNTLVRIFENVWYGNHDIDKDIFPELDIHFKTFIDEEKH